MHRILCVLVVCVLSVAPSAPAQFATDGSGLGHVVQVHVNFENGDGCDSSTKVELMKSGNSVTSGFTDKTCNVSFFDVPPGAYRLVISGRDFAGIETSEIAFDRFDSGPVEVQIPRLRPQRETVLSSTSTSVADLKVPKRAVKEFSKANQAMARQDWKSAADFLDRAVGIYPQYAAAYNNLGVVDARLGDRTKEAKDLQQAIAIDSRYVDAYVNLARMDIAENRFPDAETQLSKAVSLSPENGVILVLITYAEFMNHHLEDAVRDCRKVHALNKVPHAFAHWTAAFALEQENQIAEAGNEFREFMREEPRGDRADAARKELANIADYLSRTN